MKFVSDLIFRIALLVLVAPAIPVTDEINGLLRQVSNELELVQLHR